MAEASEPARSEPREVVWIDRAGRPVAWAGKDGRAVRWVIEAH